jgi:NTE family protein
MINRISVGRVESTPQLALVVGSGGVRSAAALGAAHALRDAGIGIDLIAGSSSGALIGATLAMGLSPDDALATVRHFWSPHLTERKRWRAYAELALPRLFGFGDQFALRDGRSIAHAVNSGFGDRRLESLPIPMRIVATDAASGNSIVLDNGRVADAVLASMALPFIFPSVTIDGRRLVDGVLSNPLPISAVMDCRAVLAIGFHGIMPRRVNRPGRLVGQITTAMINNLQAAQTRAALAMHHRVLLLDARIDPRVRLWDTDALPRMYELGRASAAQQLNVIRQLAEGARTSRAA